MTWSGGDVPHEEAAVFQFFGEAEDAKSYALNVRQTYSDGTVADWSGPASSDDPAPQVEFESSLGSGGGAARRSRSWRWRSAQSRSSSRSSLSSGLRGGARSRDAACAHRPGVRCGRRSACVAGGRLGPCGARENDPDRECRRQQPSTRRALEVQRGGGASLRGGLGHRRRGEPADRRPAAPVCRRPDDPRRSAQARRAGVVPRLLARHLRGRPSGSRSVHLRRGPESRSRAGVRHPVDLGDGSHATSDCRALGRVRRRDGGDRPLHPPDRDCTAGCATGHSRRTFAR